VGVVLVGRSTPPPVDPARERALALPIFAGVPPAALEEAARRMHAVTVAQGESVIRQGDPPDRFYVVVDGRFDVSITDDRGVASPVRTLGSDAVFGEIGLLADTPRTATVTAATPGRLLALERDDFLELVGASPGLTPRLLDLHRGARRVTG
jgi:CRP-like cAMP-binding protein